MFVFQSRKLEQLDMFEEGQLDIIVELPTSRITRMLEGRIEDFNSKPPVLVLSNNPLLISHFYFFNMEDERFKNPLVRKAFNYAIDKETIGRDIIRGQYNDLGEYGIVPPISKVFERIMYEQMMNFDTSALSDYLCGFRKGKNTQHALLQLIEKCKKILDNRGYAGAIWL